MDITNGYYQKIKKLNLKHYANETEYYSQAGLRSAEEKLLSRLPKGARILDVGCGSGRFSINASKLGFAVTGIDIVPEAIAVCKKRAKDEKLSARFFVKDITTEVLSEEFDYVFCPRFVINAISTGEHRKKAIENMYQMCKTGGVLFIESFNINWIGRGIFLPIKNNMLSIARKIKIAYCKFTSRKYKGLFPGDITYKANKTSYAPVGYAHLPSVFEIKKYLTNGKTYSIYEIAYHYKKDVLKPFRYSIWVIGQKNVPLGNDDFNLEAFLGRGRRSRHAE